MMIQEWFKKDNMVLISLMILMVMFIFKNKVKFFLFTYKILI